MYCPVRIYVMWHSSLWCLFSLVLSCENMFDVTFVPRFQCLQGIFWCLLFVILSNIRIKTRKPEPNRTEHFPILLDIFPINLSLIFTITYRAILKYLRHGLKISNLTHTYNIMLLICQDFDVHEAYLHFSKFSRVWLQHNFLVKNLFF